MELKDVKVGMLVNRVLDNKLIGDNPRTVVGFNYNMVVIAGADWQTISVYPRFLEPANDGCALCKHDHLECDEIPCLYCRHNALLENPFYDKLPDLWESADEESKPDDTYPISKDDSRLAAEIILKYADVLVACDEDTDPTDLHELAKRIRNGVCK